MEIYENLKKKKKIILYNKNLFNIIIIFFLNGKYCLY